MLRNSPPSPRSSRPSPYENRRHRLRRVSVDKELLRFVQYHQYMTRILETQIPQNSLASGEIYVHPMRSLYCTLGMMVESLQQTPAGETRKSYLCTGSITNALKSIWVRVTPSSLLISRSRGYRFQTGPLKNPMLGSAAAMARRARIHYVPLKSSLVKLFISIYGLLLECQIVCSTPFYPLLNSCLTIHFPTASQKLRRSPHPPRCQRRPKTEAYIG